MLGVGCYAINTFNYFATAGHTTLVTYLGLRCGTVTRNARGRFSTETVTLSGELSRTTARAAARLHRNTDLNATNTNVPTVERRHATGRNDCSALCFSVFPSKNEV